MPLATGVFSIEAVASIRRQESAEILNDLTDSGDEDIVDAVFEATAMAEGLPDEDDEDGELRH